MVLPHGQPQQELSFLPSHKACDCQKLGTLCRVSRQHAQLAKVCPWALGAVVSKEVLTRLQREAMCQWSQVGVTLPHCACFGRYICHFEIIVTVYTCGSWGQPPEGTKGDLVRPRKICRQALSESQAA